MLQKQKHYKTLFLGGVFLGKITAIQKRNTFIITHAEGSDVTSLKTLSMPEINLHDEVIFTISEQGLVLLNKLSNTAVMQPYWQKLKENTMQLQFGEFSMSMSRNGNFTLGNTNSLINCNSEGDLHIYSQQLKQIAKQDVNIQGEKIYLN